MKHRIGAAAIVIGLLLGVATAGPVAAYAYDGSWYYTSAIGDGELSVCYGNGTGDPITDNRAQIVARDNATWGDAVVLSFISYGSCPNNPRELQYLWGDCGDQRAIACFLGTGGSSGKTVYVNSGYNTGFGQMWWGGTPVPGGYIDMPSVLAHEVGHALGLAHSSSTDGLLHITDDAIGPNIMSNAGAYSTSGPNPCPTWENGERVILLSYDDVKGIWARYPGLTRKSGVWATNAQCVS